MMSQKWKLALKQVKIRLNQLISFLRTDLDEQQGGQHGPSGSYKQMETEGVWGGNKATTVNYRGQFDPFKHLQTGTTGT